MASYSSSPTLRLAQRQDREAIDDIWLAASLRAYEFLPSHHWWLRQQALWGGHQLNCEIWVAEQDGEICGMLALADERLVALLVAPQWQRMGVGSRLLDLAKVLRLQLQLHVFLDNTEAVEFYLQHHFKVLWQRAERYSGYPLACMKYQALLV